MITFSVLVVVWDAESALPSFLFFSGIFACSRDAFCGEVLVDASVDVFEVEVPLNACVMRVTTPVFFDSASSARLLVVNCVALDVKTGFSASMDSVSADSIMLEGGVLSAVETEVALETELEDEAVLGFTVFADLSKGFFTTEARAVCFVDVARFRTQWVGVIVESELPESVLEYPPLELEVESV